MFLCLHYMDSLSEKLPENATQKSRSLNEVHQLSVMDLCTGRVHKYCVPLLNMFSTGGEDAYFTGMMLKKSRVKLLESEKVPYPTTQMMRNLLVAQVCAPSPV